MKKEEEKKPIPWEMVDPKPPVIQSGHMENHKANKEIMYTNKFFDLLQATVSYAGEAK